MVMFQLMTKDKTHCLVSKLQPAKDKPVKMYDYVNNTAFFLSR
jgi:hypothetical protein